MHLTCLTMRLSIVFLALFAVATAIPTTPQLHAADQVILKKQQDVLHLLENIAGQLPHEHLYEVGMNYEFSAHLDHYENPTVVKYYVGLVKTGHVQPQGTPFSLSVSQLRKEVALLVQILLGAKDYETFLHTAAWARVHVNQDQFVKAFVSAVIQRHDMHGVVLPPVYEIFPHYFFDTRIIQKVYDMIHRSGYDYQKIEHEPYYHIHVNYTSYLPFGENQIAYFTEDIGLNAYYSYVMLASYILPMNSHVHEEEGHHHKIGHGHHYYYIHQQLMARYNLERLGQGLQPIKELDYYYEHIETPYKPNLRYLNSVNLPGRDEHIYITPHHHNYELVKIIRTLERRIIDAIDLGHVVTPQGTFLSLYQPEGLNILGELIEGTGHSINPRFYGHFAAVAKQLYGNVPEFNNIWEYQPSALELGYTCLRDPIFYQLYSKILQFFQYYQQALPAYQYNDLVVPGVQIEKVDVGDLVTYFSDYEVLLDNAVPQPVTYHQEKQPYPHVKAHLKRLDHKPYEYIIHVNSAKVIPGAVVRVYVGPKYNYDGLPIDLSEHRHYFYELDQFVYDLNEGRNVIVRNSHQATGQSYDWPSILQIKNHVDAAIHSQHPYNMVWPQQLYGMPARLALPKGTKDGFPLQIFVVITAGVHHQPEHYGPVTEEMWQTYQPQHYQVIDHEDYEQFTRQPIDKIHRNYQMVDVIPEYDAQIITEGNFHWGYLYKKYPGSYYYPHWQQTHYMKHHGDQHYPEHHVGEHHVSEHHVPEHHYQEHHVPEHQIVGQHYQGQQGVGQHYPEHPEHHVYGEEYKMKKPYVYQQKLQQPEGGMYYQTMYKQGMYQGHGYSGSGHYPGVTEYHSTYPTGMYPTWKGHDEYLHQYYENKPIGDVVGGVVSLDNKPLGFPLDRPIADSAFYVKNIYVKDVVVYHQEEYIPEY
ncbi:hexamerin-like [Phymastichus coffea]|uniref:hexamerin-like n=1 Tax=Phymastichus coffea TaxID=108790 RepID=UPI00273B0579|nr:hexamerin-like [Phymastichus coffea]